MLAQLYAAGRSVNARRVCLVSFQKDWVAVKELKCDDHNYENLLFDTYVFVRIPIVVTQFQFLSSNPEEPSRKQESCLCQLQVEDLVDLRQVCLQLISNEPQFVLWFGGGCK